MTQGRASYYMEPSHYEEVPNNIAMGIIEQYQKAKSSN
jgi:translation elongation factor EF-G